MVVFVVGATVNMMGKSSADHHHQLLQNMSCASSAAIKTTQCVMETMGEVVDQRPEDEEAVPTSITTSGGVTVLRMPEPVTITTTLDSKERAVNDEDPDRDRVQPPIPKLYIPKSLVRPHRHSVGPLPQHKRKMVDGIMRRLSIGSGCGSSSSTASLLKPLTTTSDHVPPEYALKVFRKRANSSGQSYELGPKIQVIDNHESVPGALPTPIVLGSSSSSVFKSDACDTALRKYTGPPKPSQVMAKSASLNTCTAIIPYDPDSHHPQGIVNNCNNHNKTRPPSPASSTTSNSSSSVHQRLSWSSTSSYSAQMASRPHVKAPPLDDFFRKPRTVAEKRLFLLQSPIEYKVMDFENSVYHLIKKLDKFKTEDTFRTQVELLMYGSVPTNRNIWKAVLYLNSECGHYQPWHLSVDEERVRLIGATGTVQLDDMAGVESMVAVDPGRRYTPAAKLKTCCGRRWWTKKLTNEAEVVAQLQALRETEYEDNDKENVRRGVSSPSPKKLIEKRTAAMAQLKPGPLSSKVRRLDQMRTDSELGPLEIYELPVQTLTAVPQLHRPLPKRVSSYLKMAVPEDEMTKEWLNYSLSMVLQPNGSINSDTQAATESTSTTPPEKDVPVTEEEPPKFHFSIPYKNGQRKILVRRVNNRKRGEPRLENHDKQMQYQLTFPGVAEKLQKPGDVPLNSEVQTILSEMIDSVAMSFSEDSFIKDDPDQNYQTEAPVKPMRRNHLGGGLGPVESRTNNGIIGRARNNLQNELRRLNVTIIDTAKIVPQEVCTKEECVHGCVCETISRLDGLASHCTKTECIFSCKCTAAELENGEQEQLRRMRDEKNRCLARTEKEFKSTVVMTNSNTILMTNSEDRKRNRTKPKRYFDYWSKGVDSAGEEEVVAGSEGDPEFGARKMDGRRRQSMAAEPRLDRKKENQWHVELEPLRHCAVVVPYISQLDVLEPWCIVHELYRCFCGNQRVDGLPFRLQTAPDGTIRANTKEALMGSYIRRRPLPVVKDELQESLELIPVKRRSSVSRCMPTDFSEQFIKNKLNADLVNTKAKLSVRKFKQARLDELIEKCLSYEDPMAARRRALMAPPQARRPPPQRQDQQQPGAQQQVQRSAEKRLRSKNQFMMHAQNELGLKITSVCSLDADEEMPEEAVEQTPAAGPTPVSDRRESDAVAKEAINYESQLSALKQKLLMKLNAILESCSNTFLDPAHHRKVSFVRYANFRVLMEHLVMFEVWRGGQKEGEEVAEHLVLGNNQSSIQTHFPDSVLVDVQEPRRKFYLSKFVADNSSKLQSSNIYIVLEGSGKDFWFVRGCQYIKEMQHRIRITPEHTRRLRIYADRVNMSQTNLAVYQLDTSGNERVHVQLPVQDGTRYLMIDLQNDFSDIGHPRWKGLLSCKHVKQAMDLAKLDRKTIQVIRGPSNLRPNIYASPHYDRRIFAGPFERDEPCMITLYQRVDNSLYLREEYEAKLNIKRERQTAGFWLYVNGPKGVAVDAVVEAGRGVGDGPRVTNSNGLLTHCRTNEQLNDGGESVDSRAAAQKGQHALSASSASAPARRTLVAGASPSLSSSSQSSVAVKAVPAASAVLATTTHNVATVLPELEIVALNRATVKRERSDSPVDPVVSITSTHKSLVHRKRVAQASTAVAEEGEAYIAPYKKIQAMQAMYAKKAEGNNSFTNINDLLSDPGVYTFRVGSTTVQRKGAVEEKKTTGSDKPGTSKAAAELVQPKEEGIAERTEDKTQSQAAYESEDDDVVLIEDSENDRIIDLDEWERVQQELDGEEDVPVVASVKEEKKEDKAGEGEEEEEDSDDENAMVIDEDATGEEENEVPAADTPTVTAAPSRTTSPVMKERVVTPAETNQSTKEMDQPSDAQLDQSIPFSGYYTSNIPNLGNIPAKILNGVITLALPIRKMPVKIGVECMDRYMWKYLQNSVSACFPNDLKVKWKFINTYFPSEDTLFKLEPSVHRPTCILTKYGVIDVLHEMKSEEDIPDPSIYVKYLASRLCVLVFNKLAQFTADEIISETLKVIKHERYQILKNNREITLLTMKNEDLEKQLSELQGAVPGPSWAQ